MTIFRLVRDLNGGDRKFAITGQNPVPVLIFVAETLVHIGEEMRERHKENLAERAMLSDMLARFESRLEMLGLESDDVPVDPRRHHSTYPVDPNSMFPPVVDPVQEIDIRNSYPKDD
jgi:hypothetical protein